MDDLTLDEALEELESAEDFLNYFGVPYDPAVVHVNRLHILQRLHNYLAQAGALPTEETARREIYAAQLARAYQDFVVSDALTEKVFKVFHMHEPQTAFVPLTAITRPLPSPAGGGAGGREGEFVEHAPRPSSDPGMQAGVRPAREGAAASHGACHCGGKGMCHSSEAALQG